MSAMSILTNKHIVVAMLVAPVLAVLAYFGVDRMVSERPHEARPGASYKLVAMSKCRYQSGECTLKNGNFSVTLRPQSRGERLIKLSLESSFPLSSAKLAIAPSESDDYPPMDMNADSDDGTRWLIHASLPDAPSPQLRLVVSAAGATYFGQTGLAFSRYETSFERDFRGGE